MSKLNVEKTNVMVFNFTQEYQFASRLYLENKLIEKTSEVKLLGTIITSDLKWHKNTEMLTKKAYQRMQILQKLKSFGIETQDLVNIYILYVRSILEQSCQVWHFSLTLEDATNLERVQKVACHLILDNKYENYEDALTTLNLDSLADRREKLCLKFAKSCIKHPKAKKMFPLNNNISHSLRRRETFYVQPARTDRLRNSTIPQLQRLLNSYM